MKKSSITLQGVSYPVRTIDVRSIPSFESECYKSVDVAGDELWDAIERENKAGDNDAAKLDDGIFYYVDDELLRRDATDKEIVDYIKENIV